VQASSLRVHKDDDMPCHASWDEPAVGMVTLEGNITRSEFEALGKEIKAALASEETARGVLIFDIQHTKSLPFIENALRDVHSYGTDPRLKWILIAGKTKLIRLMLMILFNTSSAGTRFFDDVEAARAFRSQLRLTTITHHTSSER
jgi:hypothetical protein